MKRKRAASNGYTALRAWAVLLLAVLLSPSASPAQEVTYTTVSRGEFAGTLGMIMNMAGDARETSETVYLKAPFTRTDTEESSTILDMEKGLLTILQHPSRSYYTLSLEELARSMEGVAEGMAAEGPSPEAGEPGAEYELKLTTDRTGATRSFDGYSAEEVVMTLEVVPTAEATAEPEEEGRQMVLLTQLWVSRDLPGWEAMRRAQDEMGRDLMTGGGAGFAQAMQQAFASDPRMEDGFRKSMEEMEALDGLPVETVTSFVMVPYGQDFQPEPVLASLDRPLSEVTMGGLMADAAKEGAKDAAKDAVSSLTGGLFGRKKKEEEPPEEPQEPEPTQSIVMRVTTTIEDVRTGAIADDLFQPPVEYEEATPEGLGGGI